MRNGEGERGRGIKNEWDEERDEELERGDREGKTVRVRRNAKQKG